MVLVSTVPASAAAAPSNDLITGAKAITAPFSETVDTTEATTDAEDAAINTNCGAPATNGSLWYTIDATETGYLVDVSQSDFTAGAIIATGTPGNLTLVACGPGTLGFEATAGEKYFVMVFSDNPDVVGGQLVLSVTKADPPPEVSMTVADVGKVNKRTGTATISGKFKCIGTAEFTLVQGRLQQEQDDDVQVGGEFAQEGLPCGGTFDWKVEVTPESGKFKRGMAATIALSVGCSALGCNAYETLEVVKLR